MILPLLSTMRKSAGYGSVKPRYRSRKAWVCIVQISSVRNLFCGAPKLVKRKRLRESVEVVDSLCVFPAKALIILTLRIPLASFWIDHSCSQYQGLPESDRNIVDLQILQIARENAWKRCPGCRMMVQKASGCFYITCSCGTRFCYDCGAKVV